MALLCIRDREGFQSLGIGHLWTNDVVRCRIVECVVGEDGIVTDKIESIPAQHTVVIDDDEVWKSDSSNTPGTQVVEIDWEAISKVCSPERLSRITPFRAPEYGTLEYVMMFESPLPATNIPPFLEVRRSELHTAGHVTEAFKGLFTNEELPKGFYVGEYSGEIVPTSFAEKHVDNKYLFGVNDHDTHSENGHRLPDPDERKLVHLINAEDETKSSFVRYVNSPTMWYGAFPCSEIGIMYAHRPGVDNSMFIQIKRRVFLVTTKRIPPGKEILAQYGPDYILPENHERILRVERKRASLYGKHACSKQNIKRTKKG
eukprot:TRINITY_DN12956_c0_g1_i1.p1 TRINITY_DN12956_c0_g1~~TRINITY_DN12956_c0_g1_i1.p1  ORF type:complete len:316 (+),score=51.21 TRINITY_DN12956_c0_g1_i1:50-997(+)